MILNPNCTIRNANVSGNYLGTEVKSANFGKVYCLYCIKDPLVGEALSVFIR